MYPCSNENRDDGDESNASTRLDVEFLIVEQERDDERTENTSKVGEEAAECSRSNGEVRSEPRRHETVVEVADEESWEE